jgi:hypothetical protein
LNEYKGILFVDYNHVIQRRRKRYEEDKSLFEKYGYYYMKKEIEPIIKGFSKKCYSEPREHMSESMDCECEAQTINHQSNVVMTCPATETDVMYKKRNVMQRQYDESTSCLVDRTTCLILETDPKILVEKARHFIVFGSSYMKGSIRKKFMKTLKQCRSETKERRCDEQSLRNNSLVGE